MAELPGEEEERGWRDRIARVFSAAQSLLATRLEILREELAAKAIFAAKGLAGIVIAAAFGIGAVLLFAALLAAVFAKLFGSAILGILAAGFVYALGAGAAAQFAWRALTRVRPLEFPAVSAELSRDWDAVSASLSPDDEEDELTADAESVEGLEERFRAGEE